MSTAHDESDLVDYPLNSPQPADNASAVPHVPPVTQDEVVATGVIEPKTPESKKKKAEDVAPDAPKKAKVATHHRKIEITCEDEGCGWEEDHVYVKGEWRKLVLKVPICLNCDIKFL